MAVADLAGIHPDRVGEDRIDPVLVRPGRQPPHQPFPTLGPVEFLPETDRVGLSIGPQPGINQATTGHHRRQTTGHVRHEDDLGTHQGRDPDVLDQVVVVTDQDPDPAAQQVEHAVLAAAREVRVEECVQLAEAGDRSLGSHADVGVVDVLAVSFDQPGEHGDPVSSRDLAECYAAGTAGYLLGHLHQLVPGRRLQVAVPADRPLVKAGHLGTRRDRPGGQVVDPLQVEGLVTVAMFELRSSNANLTHDHPPRFTTTNSRNSRRAS